MVFTGCPHPRASPSMGIPLMSPWWPCTLPSEVPWVTPRLASRTPTSLRITWPQPLVPPDGYRVTLVPLVSGDTGDMGGGGMGRGQGQEGTRRGTGTWKGQDPSATHVATMGWPQYVPKSSPCVPIMSSMVSPMCPKYVPHEVPQCVPNMCPMHPPSMSPTCSQCDPSMSSWCPQPVSSVSPVFPIVSSPCSQCVPNVSPNTSPMSCHTVSSICP